MIQLSHINKITKKANNMQTQVMTTDQEATHLNNMRKHIEISNVIDVLMSQSLQLMDIVNKNQAEVNRLKKEQDKLKVGK